jgi:hypothetical protein
MFLKNHCPATVPRPLYQLFLLLETLSLEICKAHSLTSLNHYIHIGLSLNTPYEIEPLFLITKFVQMFVTSLFTDYQNTTIHLFSHGSYRFCSPGSVKEYTSRIIQIVVKIHFFLMMKWNL